jgi:methyltransferase (TIGR00027 family)
MRDDSPSRTAAFVAAARQLGQLLPDNVRLVDDPYGAAFASRSVARLLQDRHDQLRPFAAMPGVRPWILYMQVRTRVIDDALREFIAAGGRQLVLLGAGYDCRALRMPELAMVDIYEVDPEPQALRAREAACRVASAVRDVGFRSAADGGSPGRAR